MVQLFLSDKNSDVNVEDNVVKERILFLERIESIIWSVISSGNRNEARLWLCDTIASIRSITSGCQCELFLRLLRSKATNKDVAAQVLRMIFEKNPEKVGPIIAKKSYMLEKFFEGNSKRIYQWFDNFAGVAESGHKKGSRALSQYAFVNRESCWEELEWKGKHGQSPAVVATKPHYFHHLDILKTVENFLEYVPDFWTSKELADSVKDGEILHLDKQYFVDRFLKLMYEENSEDIWEVVEDFLKEEEFSFIAKRLLILLDENNLLAFLKSIGRFLTADTDWNDFEHSSCWLEIYLKIHRDSIRIDELYILNAVINQGRQLLRILGEDEHEDEKERLDELLKTPGSRSSSEHWALMRECRKMKQNIAIKWIALESWTLHYVLSIECKTQESCELLFTQNGVSYRKASGYALMPSKDSKLDSKDNSLDTESDKFRKRTHKKRMRNSKRRRKNYDHDDVSEELLDYGFSNPHTGGWLLSTDNYSTIWHIVDIPNYLSRYLFSTWMKWVFSSL